MLPPMTRIERVRAETVAIKSSGHIIVVIIEAGTTIPPIPNPAIMRRAHSVDRLCLLAHASAPHPKLYALAR